MKRDSISRPRVLAFALAGLVIGAVAGFVLGFAIVAMLPRGNFGEMQGVAALDVALLAGAPLGALLFCWVAARRGLRPKADASTTKGKPK